MTKKLFILALSLLLTACFDEKALLQKLIPKDDDVFARHFIEAVRTGDYVTAQQMLDASLRGEKAANGLQALHGVIAHGEPLTFETIGYNFEASRGTRRTNLTYQIHFPASWVVGNVYLSKGTDASYVLASHFKPIPDSLEVLNRFSLQGKSTMHYAVLAACVLIPSFILYALVICARSQIPRKWLWIIFILFGVFQLHLDWTSGRFEVQPLSFLLFGAGASCAGLYAPWVLSCAFPLGAVIFLARRRKLVGT